MISSQGRICESIPTAKTDGRRRIAFVAFDSSGGKASSRQRALERLMELLSDQQNRKDKAQ